MTIALEVARLAMLLSSDWPSARVDVLYIPGLSPGMLDSSGIFDIAAKAVRSGQAGRIAFNGSDGEGASNPTPGSAWPGRNYYETALRRRHVSPRLMVPTGPGLHTRDETDKFVLAAKQHGWRRAGYLTVAYHYPRVFSCLVKSIQEIGYSLDVFACCPPTTNWYLPMLGSQGLAQTTSFEAALDDINKTMQYVEKGFGAPPEDVFTYLKSRRG